MSQDWVAVTIQVPGWAYRPARRMKSAIAKRCRPFERFPNLLGDRAIEWSFVCAHLPFGPGEALDFGAQGAYLSLIAARRGFRVTALDLQPGYFYWHHKAVRCVQCDILKIKLPSAYFSLVINCSSIEHVGLAGRYRTIDACPDGDLVAMAKMREAMRPGALMLLTTPVGRDAVFHPVHRVYGTKRLPLLLEGFRVEQEEFWMKSDDNRWCQCDREAALSFEPHSFGGAPRSNAYALGCFVLHGPAS